MIQKEKYQLLFENFIKEEEDWVKMAKKVAKEMNEVEFDIKPAKIPNPKGGNIEGYAKFVKVDPKSGKRSDQEGELVGTDLPDNEPDLRAFVQGLIQQFAPTQEQGEADANAVGVLHVKADEDGKLVPDKDRIIQTGREEAERDKPYYDNIHIGDEMDVEVDGDYKGAKTQVIDKDPDTFSITWAVKYDDPKNGGKTEFPDDKGKDKDKFLGKDGAGKFMPQTKTKNINI